MHAKNFLYQVNMKVEQRREDNMYNALAKIVYRMPLEEYRLDSEYKTLNSLIHSNIE